MSINWIKEIIEWLQIRIEVENNTCGWPLLILIYWGSISGPKKFKSEAWLLLLLLCGHTYIICLWYVYFYTFNIYGVSPIMHDVDNLAGLKFSYIWLISSMGIHSYQFPSWIYGVNCLSVFKILYSFACSLSIVQWVVFLQ